MSAATEPTREPCGCSWDGRCEKHGEMMIAIHHAWSTSRDERVLDVIWSLSDGYGEPGFVPSQGYDWSGIRDSSTAAVEAMYAAIRS